MEELVSAKVFKNELGLTVTKSACVKESGRNRADRKCGGRGGCYAQAPCATSWENNVEAAGQQTALAWVSVVNVTQPDVIAGGICT